MSNYYKVDEAKIEGLRKFADALSGNELMAVVLMWGLRSVQEANIDMVSSGDARPDELAQYYDAMVEMAADMVCDAINTEDLCKVAHANDLGDYSVDFTVKTTIVHATKKV